jgi:hypothetical protein
MRLPVSVGGRKTVGFIGLRSQERKEKTMKTFKRTCIGMAFLLALTGVAQAVDLFTPVTSRQSSGFLVCVATNVSSTTHTLNVQLRNSDGTVLVDSGAFTLAPGATGVTSVASPATGYCKVTVSGTSNKEVVRGAILSQDSSFDIISALPAN